VVCICLSLFYFKYAMPWKTQKRKLLAIILPLKPGFYNWWTHLLAVYFIRKIMLTLSKPKTSFFLQKLKKPFYLQILFYSLCLFFAVFVQFKSNNFFRQSTDTDGAVLYLLVVKFNCDKVINFTVSNFVLCVFFHGAHWCKLGVIDLFVWKLHIVSVLMSALQVLAWGIIFVLLEFNGGHNA
jgi:hypothetical protein